MEEDIDEARENLQNALGERFADYMSNLKKWFSGKTLIFKTNKSTKQEFDTEARTIVTDNYIHLHNEFLLCIITKCNNFSTIVSDALSKPLACNKQLYQEIQKKNQLQQQQQLLKSKKKLKTTSQTAQSTKSTLFRFVPVDSIKHAPSIVTHSLESVAQSRKDFALEFCARERSLPYFRMIHNRLLLGAIDFNLQNIDIKTVFLLAEATTWLLKNIISMLASRSQFKKAVRCEAAYEQYKETHHLNEPILGRTAKKRSHSDVFSEFDFCPNILKNKQKKSPQHIEEHDESSLGATTDSDERETLESLSSNLNNPAIVPTKKLPTTLFDLKNLLQTHRHLMPSHSIFTINMEKLICNLYHDDDNIEVETTNKND